jgi:hypothetical protein
MNLIERDSFIFEMENEEDKTAINDLLKKTFKAWNDLDIETLLVHYQGLIEFGYRTEDIRNTNAVGLLEVRNSLSQSFEKMESLKVEPISGIIRQFGNTVVLAGFFREIVLLKNKQQIGTKFRYTITFIKQNNKWKSILEHRDNLFPGS